MNIVNILIVKTLENKEFKIENMDFPLNPGSKNSGIIILCLLHDIYSIHHIKCVN